MAPPCGLTLPPSVAAVPLTPVAGDVVAAGGARDVGGEDRVRGAVIHREGDVPAGWPLMVVKVPVWDA